MGEVGQANPLEGLGGSGPLGGPRSAEPAQLAVGAHQHDIGHGGGEVPIDGAALRNVSDCLIAGRIRLTSDEDSPRDGLDEAEDGLNERGFAGPVGTDHGHEDTGRHPQVDIPQHRGIPVRHREIVNFNGRNSRSHRRSASAMTRAL